MLALGFIFLSLGGLPLLQIPSRIANPLLVAGRIALLLGALSFMGRQVKLGWISAIFFTFLGSYYTFMFVHPSIVGRTITVSATICLYSVMTAHALLAKGTGPRSASSRFTAGVFLAHGTFLAALVLYTLLAKPIATYASFAPIQIAAFIVPTITSTLWTFGFILMVNQRLILENAEEHRNLQRIFNTSPDAASITRLSDGLVVDVNQGFLAMSGYTREEVLGNSTLSMKIWHHPEDRETFLWELVATGGCENREFLFDHKEGKSLVGLLSAKIISINQAPHIISVVRDISERKRMEAALRESEETYRSILNASPDDITITDLEGRLLMVSPVANAMFGYEPGEGDGMRIQQFIVPEDLPRAMANIQKMLEGGNQGTNEYRGIRKDGSSFDIEVNSGLVHTGDRPSRMVFIVRDITTRRRAEQERAELEARNRQLQKSESLGRMAGAIAHHFNNQLQSVLVNLELLSELPKGSDPTPRLAGAKWATERAAEVSRLMLSYLGQTSHKQEPCALSDLCRGSLAVIQNTLPGSVTLQVDLPTPGPYVLANLSELQQVLSNLIANAAESLGDQPGNLLVRLSSVDTTQLPLGRSFPVDWRPEAPGYACLEVIDTGCGIAESEFDKLFDPFFSTKFIGRGLGLSVVLGIVQAHGGSVLVESQPGQGSSFKVLLPLEAASTSASVATNQDPGTLEAWGAVLLVDDDPVLLESTGALIEHLGFQLLTAMDGVEALELYPLHRERIRCVITDLTMPRMDGWATLAALRKLDPDLPVILASGYSQTEVLASLQSERPQVFLGKPYGRQQLMEALAKVLS